MNVDEFRGMCGGYIGKVESKRQLWWNLFQICSQCCLSQWWGVSRSTYFCLYRMLCRYGEGKLNYWGLDRGINVDNIQEKILTICERQVLEDLVSWWLRKFIHSMMVIKLALLLTTYLIKYIILPPLIAEFKNINYSKIMLHIDFVKRPCFPITERVWLVTVDGDKY